MFPISQADTTAGAAVQTVPGSPAGFRLIAAEGNRTLEELMEGLELGLRVMEADETLRAEGVSLP